MSPVGAAVCAPGGHGGALLLGRYRLVEGRPLGTGGWCIVRRAEDVLAERRGVALKTFGPQAVRDHSSGALAARFAHEVRTFEVLGVGPGAATSSSAPPPRADEREERLDPRGLLVNLLDFSPSAGSGLPGPAPDGAYYTVLELANDALDVWLQRRKAAEDYVGLPELCLLARAVACGLAWLHSCGVVHLDVKPENIMRFGGAWKLIDLEGCLPISGTKRVSRDSFTPLYASPELARFAISGAEEAGPPPSEKMDCWAAGVVLLDVLAHAPVFQETKASFDAMALFDEEVVASAAWYHWLSDPEPLPIADFVAAPVSSAELLRNSSELQELLRQLLAKDPKRRPSANELRRHPLLLRSAGAATPAPPQRAGLPPAVARPHAPPKAQRRPAAAAGGRAEVEGVFTQCGVGRGSGRCADHAMFLNLLVQVGLPLTDAAKILDAINPLQKDSLSFNEFLDFIYKSSLAPQRTRPAAAGQAAPRRGAASPKDGRPPPRRRRGRTSRRRRRRQGERGEAREEIVALEAPTREDPGQCARRERLRKVIKEGGKRGVEIAGQADLGGLQYFSTAVELPDGDVELLLESVRAMNAEPHPAEEEQRGGSGHIGKMVFSAGSDQLAIVAYVPEAKQKEVSCQEWLRAMLGTFGGDLLSVAGCECSGRVKADREKDVFPLKIREQLIVESNNFLRRLGLFPEDDNDEDDDVLYGDDDFPL